MQRQPVLRMLTAAFLLVAGCGDGGDRAADGTASTASTTSTTSAGPVDEVATCRAAADGYEVEYPAHWFTTADGAEPCRLFHPEPFDPGPELDLTSDVAVVIQFTSADHQTLVSETLEDPAGASILSNDSVTVAGRPATRIETEATGETALPEGTRSTRYFVDFGSRTMIARTLGTVEDVEYERASEVLDGMMASMQSVEEPGELATCSASELSASPVAQPELPEPVRAMREAIVEAAVACDFARLEELAARGPGTFTYSFGGDGDPGGYWLAQEADERGPDPLRFLVELLDRPYRQIGHDHVGQSQFVWPSAFAYESWSDVPEREQQALEPLYTEEDFAGFEDFGGYIGYRVGITPDGDWIFFVAGD